MLFKRFRRVPSVSPVETYNDEALDFEPPELNGHHTEGRNPHIIVTTLIERDGGQYASICPELGVASCGDSIQEAINNLDDAIELYLDHLESAGFLSRVFAEKGIELHRHESDLDESVQRLIPLNVLVKVNRHPLPSLVA